MAVRSRELDAADGHWLFDVGGMDCADCVRTVEVGVRRLPGVAEATANLAAGTLTVRLSDHAATAGSLTPDRIVAEVERAGYVARPRTGAAPAVESAAALWWQRRVLECGIAVLLWLVGFAGERLGAPDAVTIPAYLLAMAVAGYPAARAAWYSVRSHRADMNLLMTVAAVGAVALGEWGEGASAIVLFAVGLTLQALTVDRTRRAIRSLMALAPAEARVVQDGHERLVPVAEVAVGERVLVRPGERMPVDGEVVAGRSALDQSTVTGESVPVGVEPGAAVFAGSINGDGALEVRSTKPADDTTLAHIVRLVEESQASRAPAQAFVDRFAAIYTPVVIAIAGLVAIIGPIATGDVRDWINRALILLVVACPCALVISTPVALVSAIGAASRRGVLFKGGAAIEALAAVKTVAFDKTGTLTAGRPSIVQVIPFAGSDLTSDDVLSRAAAVEQRASHPLARAVVLGAHERGLAIPAASDSESLPGLGAQATIDGEAILVGSPRLFNGAAKAVQVTLDAAAADGLTPVLIGGRDRVDGLITFADTLRPQSGAAIRELEALRLRTVMLSGDNQQTADRIGAAAGVRDIRAELLPEEKVAAVTALKADAAVAMVGDGVNDAPALAAASVGIAMGVAGTDVALEAADVALMRDDLSQLPAAIRLARRTLATIRENIAASLLVKAAFLVLTFVGVTNLWLAVLADTGMSLIVTANALRLIEMRRSPAEDPRHLATGMPVAEQA